MLNPISTGLHNIPDVCSRCSKSMEGGQAITDVCLDQSDPDSRESWTVVCIGCETLEEAEYNRQI